MRNRVIAFMGCGIAVIGCAASKSDKKTWSQGVVVATNMCAGDRSRQSSKDPVGERAFCELEEVVGSHIPKCVCRDEKQIVGERDESQQYMRNASQTREVIRGN